jgi:hypothetical protein
LIIQNKPTEKRGIRGERRQITARTKVYLVIASIKTIIPFPYVRKACMLGYNSGCSFVPKNTAMLIVAAIITYVVAKRKNIL